MRTLNRYESVHKALVRQRGRASIYICACGAPAVDWAYQGGDTDERVCPVRGMVFSPNLYTYSAMCRPCHRQMDNAHITQCPAGHEYTPGNTRTNAGKRKCIACQRDRDRNRPYKKRPASYYREWRKRKKAHHGAQLRLPDRLE